MSGPGKVVSENRYGFCCHRLQLHRNFGKLNENDFKKIIQILKDRRRTSVSYFSSKNRTDLDDISL